MIIEKSGSDSLHKFESYNEFVERSLHAPKINGCLENKLSSQTLNEKSFNEKSFEEVARIAPVGDIVKAKTLHAPVTKEANRIMREVARLDPVYREEGGSWIDVSRFISGEPEVWGQMASQGQKRIARHVHYTLVAGVTGMFTAEDYAKTAGIIAGALIGFRASGYSIGISVVYETASGSNKFDTMVFPLSTETGFDIAKLAAVLSPWFHRRIKFGVMETLGKDYQQTFYNYGASCFSIDQRKAERVTGQKNTQVIVVQSWIGKEDALKKALKPREVSK